MTTTTNLALDPDGELWKWDTEFWNVRIGRGSGPGLDQWAKDNAIGCMCLLVPAADHADIHRAEEQGFRMMDVRVEFHAVTGPRVAVSRTVAAQDVDALAAISRTAFRGLTRFYADPRFDNQRCDDLYETWLRSSCDGYAAEVLMIGDGGGPAGFVTIHADGPGASIGLIAVDQRVRKKGMGANLARAAVNWAYEQRIPEMSVVTQGCNLPAQRAFAAAGFAPYATDVWLHKWYA